MRFLVLLLCLFVGSCYAGVENMVAQCEAVMVCPLCRVANDKTVYPGNVVPLIINNQRVDVSVEDYNWIREAGYGMENSRHIMCIRVEQAMQNPLSGKGTAARYLFNENWIKQEYCP